MDTMIEQSAVLDQRERDLLMWDRGWQAGIAYLTPGTTLIGIGARTDAAHQQMLANRRRTAAAWAALDDADAFGGDELTHELTQVRQRYGLHPFGPDCTPACRNGTRA